MTTVENGHSDTLSDVPASAGGRNRRVRSARPRLPRGVLAGVATTLVILVLGSLFFTSRSAAWTAESQLLVAPSATGAEDLSAYYETLSRGQVTETAAAMIGTPQFVAAAEEDLGIQDAGPVDVRVTVVPQTALINVAVTAADRSNAERLADEVPRQAIPDVERLLQPFVLQRVGDGPTQATRSDLSGGQLLAVLGLVALVAGVAVQQLIYQMSTSRWRLRFFQR